MALPTLAVAAVAAFAQAVGTRLGGEVVGAFTDLVRWRFSGDRHSLEALNAVELNPANESARRELTRALAHYAQHDPDFRRGLAEAVQYIEYHLDQSHSSAPSIGRDNRGVVSSRVEDRRVYQSGQNIVGGDVNIDRSSTRQVGRDNIEGDQMIAMRDAFKVAVTPDVTNRMAIVSLLTGVLAWIMLPVIMAIVAIATGSAAKREIDANNDKGRGLATVGIVLGWTNLVAAAIAIVLLLLLIRGILGGGLLPGPASAQERFAVQVAMHEMAFDQGVEGDICDPSAPATNQMQSFPTSRTGGSGTGHPVALYPRYLQTRQTQWSYTCNAVGDVAQH